LNDQNYPWQLLDSGNPGETNWTVDGGTWSALYFIGAVGNDWDSDGIPNYMDANPHDASVGALTITIDSPLNGTVLQ
jgi:hypothetical protein